MRHTDSNTHTDRLNKHTRRPLLWINLIRGKASPRVMSDLLAHFTAITSHKLMLHLCGLRYPLPRPRNTHSFSSRTREGFKRIGKNVQFEAKKCTRALEAFRQTARVCVCLRARQVRHTAQWSVLFVQVCWINILMTIFLLSTTTTNLIPIATQVAHIDVVGCRLFVS